MRTEDLEKQVVGPYLDLTYRIRNSRCGTEQFLRIPQGDSEAAKFENGGSDSVHLCYRLTFDISLPYCTEGYAAATLSPTIIYGILLKLF